MLTVLTEHTTLLRWNPRLSKRRRAACVEAVQSAGYAAWSEGDDLVIPHGCDDFGGSLLIFLAGAGRSPKLFSGAE